jgi:hypothetical protein
MAHKWNSPVNRHEAHAVTCQLCGVFVERVFEGTRGVNFNTVFGGERVRGLAPKCPGAINVDELELAADAAPEEALAGEDEEPADETTEEPEAEDEDDDEDEDAELSDEQNALNVYIESLSKHMAMNRKALDKLAAGKVKNYKKINKEALVEALARLDEAEALRAA